MLLSNINAPYIYIYIQNSHLNTELVKRKQTSKKYPHFNKSRVMNSLFHL